MKRFLDFTLSLFGLLASAPVLMPIILLVWLQDFKSPFYIAPRVGKNSTEFKMVKLRSMVVNADRSGVDSTSVNDSRITPVGMFIRKFKLDELTQLYNVLLGHMSLVGPRPNVRTETELYTTVEKNLLSVRPGITDFSSIVFSDEGEILMGKDDPDLAYNQLIRPWKSRLGLAYIEHRTTTLDFKLIGYTLLSLVSRRFVLHQISEQLGQFQVEADLIKIARRDDDLYPAPPPGSDSVVVAR